MNMPEIAAGQDNVLTISSDKMHRVTFFIGGKKGLKDVTNGKVLQPGKTMVNATDFDWKASHPIPGKEYTLVVENIDDKDLAVPGEKAEYRGIVQAEEPTDDPIDPEITGVTRSLDNAHRDLTHFTAHPETLKKKTFDRLTEKVAGAAQVLGGEKHRDNTNLNPLRDKGIECSQMLQSLQASLATAAAAGTPATTGAVGTPAAPGAPAAARAAATTGAAGTPAAPGALVAAARAAAGTPAAPGAPAPGAPTATGAAATTVPSGSLNNTSSSNAGGIKINIGNDVGFGKTATLILLAILALVGIGIVLAFLNRGDRSVIEIRTTTPAVADPAPRSSPRAMSLGEGETPAYEIHRPNARQTSLAEKSPARDQEVTLVHNTNVNTCAKVTTNIIVAPTLVLVPASCPPPQPKASAEVEWQEIGEYPPYLGGTPFWGTRMLIDPSGQRPGYYLPEGSELQYGYQQPQPRKHSRPQGSH